MPTRTALLTLVLLSQTSWSASFDCNKASTATEQAICGNPETGRLDERLAATYRLALKMAQAKKETLRQEQRAWLRSRNALCGGETECLDRAYHERIQLLEQSAGLALRRSPPCSSLYLYPHITSILGSSDWQSTLVQDRLMFHPVDKGRAAFFLSSVGANAHSCTFEGIAEKRNDRWIWESSQYALDSGKAETCRLEFSAWDGGYLSVTVGKVAGGDEHANACQRYFCGVRAYVPENNAFIPAEKLLTPGECQELQYSLGDF
jgi:uncharacterized protein YecT (DUF1311 family)